jgi:hypothetical protein
VPGFLRLLGAVAYAWSLRKKKITSYTFFIQMHVLHFLHTPPEKSAKCHSSRLRLPLSPDRPHSQ